MSLQTRLLIAAILLVVMFWLLRQFFHKRVSSGQTLFWLSAVTGAIVLAIFPSVLHWIGRLWGDLLPISWLTFGSLVFMTFYLLYLTIRLNRMARISELARTIAYLERRLRELERRSSTDGEAPSRP